MADGEQAKSFRDTFRILYDADTDMGPMMLRKRWSMALECDVYEMTIDGMLMMSNAVVESECALAERALGLLPDSDLHVLIGGLGFGFTARATLADPRVAHLTVIERLAPVIDWHRTGVLPWSQEFVSDPRLDIVKGDFFELVARDPAKRYHAILIDIDDSPDLLWHKSHAAFYNRNGIKAIERHLVSGGVLGLWYAAEPDGAFVAAVRDVFASADLVEVHFENPCLRQPETNYLVLARSHDANRHSA